MMEEKYRLISDLLKEGNYDYKSNGCISMNIKMYQYGKKQQNQPYQIY